MDRDVVVAVEGLSKQYRLGTLDRNTFWDDLRGWWVRRAGGPHAAVTAESGQTDGSGANAPFFALDDVSFEVRRGETLGIVGRNGAGKSTLLKILSRITVPTRGTVSIRGRVASLLEVGTGFHPELTGRENVYLNGSILGLTKTEIRGKFDEILAFAEIEEFIDTPVKRYSSGMYVRLAFAVAAHLDPEILIVDEVLAVGDAGFQRKCLDKIGDVGAHGRTVLMVSHNMTAVQRWCQRALLLSKGRLVVEDSADAVVREYLKATVQASSERTWTLDEAPGNDIVRLLAVRLLDARGAPAARFDVRDPVTIEFRYRVDAEGHQVYSHVQLERVPSVHVLTSFDNAVREPWHSMAPHPTGEFRSTCTIPGDFLNEGEFSVHLRIFSNTDLHVAVKEIDAVQFSVNDRMDPGGARGTFPYDWGIPPVRPRLAWTRGRF